VEDPEKIGLEDPEKIAGKIIRAQWPRMQTLQLNENAFILEPQFYFFIASQK
jgi:hypothetical protein